MAGGKKTSIYLNEGTINMVEVLADKYSRSTSSVINKAVEICYPMGDLKLFINDYALAAMKCGRFDLLTAVQDEDCVKICIKPYDKSLNCDDVVKLGDSVFRKKKRLLWGAEADRILEIHDSNIPAVEVKYSKNLEEAYRDAEDIINNIKKDIEEYNKDLSADKQITVLTENVMESYEDVATVRTLVLSNGRSIMITMRKK